MKKAGFLLFFVVIILWGCEKKDGPWPHTKNSSSDQTADSLISTASEKSFLIISNEGNFGWGNASLSIYYPDEKKVLNNVFQSVNHYNLGDVFQSAYVFDQWIFLMIDNSHKIEVIEKETFKKVKTISNNVFSPRYFLPVSPDKAYVTSIWGKRIHVLNLNSLEVSHTVYYYQPTEKMLPYGDKVLVSCPQSNKILIIDSQTDKIIDSLETAEFPNSMVTDVNQNLWVACSGNSNGSGWLQKFNLLSNQKVAEFAFPSNQKPQHLQTDATRNYLLYFNNGNIYQMHISDNDLPTVPVLQTTNMNVYNFSIDVQNNEYYITDAKDYIQPGDVYRVDQNFQFTDTFQVGIIPGNITFKY